MKSCILSNTLIRWNGDSPSHGMHHVSAISAPVCSSAHQTAEKTSGSSSEIEFHHRIEQESYLSSFPGTLMYNILRMAYEVLGSLTFDRIEQEKSYLPSFSPGRYRTSSDRVAGTGEQLAEFSQVR